MRAGGELVDVAKATIIQPKSSQMHNQRMNEALMRIKLDEVLPQFQHINPQMQPAVADDDEHMVLGA